MANRIESVIRLLCSLYAGRPVFEPISNVLYGDFHAALQMILYGNNSNS
jgi:hypothetical protein